MIETSETTAKLDAALAKAQGEIEAASKDKVNPAFRSKYADLTSVWAAIRPALSKHGIAITQWPVHSDDNRLHIVTRLAHEGEWIRAEFSIPVVKQDPHGYGSATTYAKRFSLAACVGVVADDDDDGNAASNKPQESSGKPKLSVHAERTMSQPDTAGITGTPGAPKNANAKALYEMLIKEMEQAKTVEALKEWLKLRRPEIEKLPQEWLEPFDEAYGFRRESLAGVQAA